MCVCLHSIQQVLFGAQFGSLTRFFRAVLSLAATGKRSFVPWVASLVADASSHVLLQRNTVSSKKYSHIEAKELKRRYIGLLFYLLRSPFYDRYAK